MSYEIEPYAGVGPIRLGMSREEIHALLVEGRQPTQRGSERPGDFFPTLGVFVDYRAPGACEFVEFAKYSPLSPTFQGKSFLDQPFRQVRAWLERYDPDVETDGAGCVSKRLGIALYARAAEKEPDDPVEGVAVFEQGYYDPTRTTPQITSEHEPDSPTPSPASATLEPGATQLPLFDRI